MAETGTEWTQLLDNMSKLEALSKAASTGAEKVSGWRSRMVSMVSSMTDKLKAIRSKINTIKDQGNNAKKACQDLIKANYEPQQQAIKGILENIETMTNIEEVRNAERELKSLARRVPIKNNLFKIIQYSKM